MHTFIIGEIRKASDSTGLVRSFARWSRRCCPGQRWTARPSPGRFREGSQSERSLSTARGLVYDHQEWVQGSGE